MIAVISFVFFTCHKVIYCWYKVLFSQILLDFVFLNVWQMLLRLKIVAESNYQSLFHSRAIANNNLSMLRDKV
jgi:hypothetical protein